MVKAAALPWKPALRILYVADYKVILPPLNTGRGCEIKIAGINIVTSNALTKCKYIAFYRNDKKIPINQAFMILLSVVSQYMCPGRRIRI